MCAELDAGRLCRQFTFSWNHIFSILLGLFDFFYVLMKYCGLNMIHSNYFEKSAHFLIIINVFDQVAVLRNRSLHDIFNKSTPIV